MDRVVVGASGTNINESETVPRTGSQLAHGMPGLRVPGRQAEPDFALYHQLSHRIVDRQRQDQPLRRCCTCNGRG